MFEYIKSTYKVGDRILVKCYRGDIKGEIIYLGDDSIGILSDDDKKRHILKGADITYCEDVIDHEYVDLGLPSGTLWATCNIGADKPWEYGDYFACGEIKPKKNYSWLTYKWCEGCEKTLTKYCKGSEQGKVDCFITLLPEDDAATVNWGGDWRMPTHAEQQELMDGCDWEWTGNFKNSDVAGRIGTSKANGNTIFLPAAGRRYDKDLDDDGNCGDYYSSSINGKDLVCTYCLFFDYNRIHLGDNYRYSGKSVRAVVNKK